MIKTKQNIEHQKVNEEKIRRAMRKNIRNDVSDFYNYVKL